MEKKPPRHRSRSTWLTLLVITGTTVLLIGGGVVAIQPVQSLIGSQSVLAAAPAPTPSSETLPPDYPAEKKAGIVADQEMVATAVAVHATKPAKPQPPSPQPAPGLEAGIVNGVQQGPFSSAEFTIENWWKGPSGPGWLLVYAGATKNVRNGTLGQAALRLYTMTPNTLGGFDLGYIGTFPASTTSGPLMITVVNGDVVRLRTKGWAIVTFNLLTHQYQ